MICNKLDVITSEFQSSSTMCVNTAMVTAVVNTGQGFSQLDTFTAFLNLPNISNPTYQKIHGVIQQHTKDIAFEAMINAGKEEAILAIKENRVNANGIPLITVIADGAWSKRSYKSGYNALSGVVSTYLLRVSILYFNIKRKMK